MTLTNIIPAPFALNRFEGFRSDLRARYGAWKVYRQTRDELNALSDRELADLGMHRSGITAVAMEAAYNN